ncbi:MAG TPA: helix-hairpin-helix domain-containing protein, partial [Agriterribacter sp.]|nr:helix-hairpin-helix domain-containing protein [Agriterribacter sp.]
MIDNYYIADQFSLLSKLMDIHGENSFKAKSYAIAAYSIEKLPAQLMDLPNEKIFGIKGIGDAIGKKILEIKETGKLNALEESLQKTPAGILEMLHIKGLGPKKIAVIWKEMGMETIGELLYACNENRLMLFKGFGEKTQQNVKSYIEFYLRSKGSHLFAEIESYAQTIQQLLKARFQQQRFEHTGAFARQQETIDRLEWVSTADSNALEAFFTGNQFSVLEKTESTISFKGDENVTLTFYTAQPENFGTVLFHTSCAGAFLNAWEKRYPATQTYSEQEQVFTNAGVPYILPCMREKETMIDTALTHPLPQLIQPGDVKGIVHSHSDWSDGRHTLRVMAEAAAEKGFEYLVISDHSKSAFYANGLKEDRIKEQHLYIDSLNEALHPFKIFKSIEADILNDGNLDYADGILSTFDLVIASVHSNLKMTEEKAMMRVLTAIQNPYTTILGHMTGRLLLSREGYPLDHKQVIDACVAHDVVIELNAHPRRLDIDWRWIDYALER